MFVGATPRGVWLGPDCHPCLASSAFWLSATGWGVFFVFKRAVMALFTAPEGVKFRIDFKSGATLETGRDCRCANILLFFPSRNRLGREIDQHTTLINFATKIIF